MSMPVWIFLDASEFIALNRYPEYFGKCVVQVERQLLHELLATLVPLV
jgi:hypothetical protein